MINVTKTYLPPLEEYVHYLEGIWERNHVTNNGPLVKELEAKLKNYLGVKHLFLVSNGTIALQIAIKALDLTGEIITTPFSYVATTSSIVWEGCTPVFVDIDPSTCCINPDLIERAITPSTSAILAVHVYGYPCDVERIQAIADKHGLSVIYDAAHAFGVRYKSHSLLNYGKISTLSFHATKLFHTVEGGAIITDDDTIAHRISYMRNFGHRTAEEFWGLGINGKNSEIHAAMGLCILPRIGEIILARQVLFCKYDQHLESLGITRFLQHREDVTYNYAYYPVMFSTHQQLCAVTEALNRIDVFPRRYFYPSLSQLPYVNHVDELRNAQEIASRVLCLPIAHDLTELAVVRICQCIADETQ